MNQDGSAYCVITIITIILLEKKIMLVTKHNHTSAATVIRIPRCADAMKVINRVHTSAPIHAGVVGAFVDICREYERHLLKVLVKNRNKSELGGFIYMLSVCIYEVVKERKVTAPIHCVPGKGKPEISIISKVK